VSTLTLAEYAATHGAGGPAATKWKSRGLLTMTGGKVDVEASDVRMERAMTGRFNPKRFTGPNAGSRDSVGEAHPRHRASPPINAVAIFGDADSSDIPLIDDDGLNRFVADLLARRFRSLADANEIKENALALKHVLAARKEAGAVIDIEVAERVLFEAGRSLRDAMLSFPSRVGPLLAADLGIAQERLVEALSEHMHRQLADLGEPEADFAAAD